MVGCWGAVAADLRRSLTAPFSRHFIITMRQACATSSAAHAQSASAPTMCAGHRSSKASKGLAARLSKAGLGGQDIDVMKLGELETGQLAGPGGWSPGMQQVAEQCFRPPGSDAPSHPSLSGAPSTRATQSFSSPPSQQQQ